LLASDDDQRRGSDALSLRFDLGGSASLTAVVADYAPHRLAEGPLPKPLRRDNEPERLDFGLRLDHVGDRTPKQPMSAKKPEATPCVPCSTPTSATRPS
jgi:hypothetical protein